MRRPDNEPLLFDLPLDRPVIEDDLEPAPVRPPQPAAGGAAPAGRRGQPPPRGETPAPRPPRQRESPPPGQAGIAGLAEPAGPTGRYEPAGRHEPPGLATPLRQPARNAPSGPLDPPQTAPSAPPDPPRRTGAAAAIAGPGAAGPAAAPSATLGAGDRREPSSYPGAPAVHPRAGIGRRLAAGAADLLVHAAVAVLALAGCRYLGVVPELADAPAVALFLLAFSFLYTVVPLAFWGRTLGMTWAGLAAESADGQPLSFDQTARRWLGALLTLALLALPLLLAATGRSLADRLSGSRTLAAG
jgi:uncharacterized RDD family membrane protein YckC